MTEKQDCYHQEQIDRIVEIVAKLLGDAWLRERHWNRPTPEPPAGNVSTTRTGEPGR